MCSRRTKAKRVMIDEVMKTKLDIENTEASTNIIDSTRGVAAKLEVSMSHIIALYAVASPGIVVNYRGRRSMWMKLIWLTYSWEIEE